MEYSPLISALKKQTEMAKNQNQELNKIHGFKKTVMYKPRENSVPVYNNFNFNEFNITDEKVNKISVNTKCKHLQQFFSKRNKLRTILAIIF